MPSPPPAPRPAFRELPHPIAKAQDDGDKCSTWAPLPSPVRSAYVAKVEAMHKLLPTLFSLSGSDIHDIYTLAYSKAVSLSDFQTRESIVCFLDSLETEISETAVGKLQTLWDDISEKPFNVKNDKSKLPLICFGLEEVRRTEKAADDLLVVMKELKKTEGVESDAGDVRAAIVRLRSEVKEVKRLCDLLIRRMGKNLKD